MAWRILELRNLGGFERWNALAGKISQNSFLEPEQEYRTALRISVHMLSSDLSHLDILPLTVSRASLGYYPQVHLDSARPTLYQRLCSPARRPWKLGVSIHHRLLRGPQINDRCLHQEEVYDTTGNFECDTYRNYTCIWSNRRKCLHLFSILAAKGPAMGNAFASFSCLRLQY